MKNKNICRRYKATAIIEGANKNRKGYGGLVCNFFLDRLLGRIYVN